MESDMTLKGDVFTRHLKEMFSDDIFSKMRSVTSW